MKDDESIRQCRLFLHHPLSIKDDIRLVSAVELMAIRESIHYELGPYDRPVDDHSLDLLNHSCEKFKDWYTSWDAIFSLQYENAGTKAIFLIGKPLIGYLAFYRQSLQLQYFHAELFHNATALRGIDGPEDVRNMSKAHRRLALRSMDIAWKGLEMTINSQSYIEKIKYGEMLNEHLDNFWPSESLLFIAIQYEHATATFAASFLLRLARFL
jgi:hypothetical protein